VKVNEAFETLLRPLRQALKEAQVTGTCAFQEGRFDDARAAARRAEEIDARLKQLEALQHQWPTLVQGAETPRVKRKRLPRGQKTPGRAFRLPILAALEEMDGRGRPREVLDRVENMVKHRLTEVDWEVLSDGRTVRWRNTAQWERYEMVKQGLLASDSPRGIWEITEAGRAYLREHRMKIGGAANEQS